MPDVLFRDKEGWQATLRTAAEQLDIDEIAVEKDYWVCQVLHGIATSDRGVNIVFKGGTSLEKLRLTQRFSEDIDALVLIPGDLANKPYADYLKRVVEDAASVAGITLGAKEGSGGKKGSFHRAVWLHYRDAPVTGPTGLVDEGQILLELGESGGPHPEIRYDVTSLLGRQLAEGGMDVTAYQDLAPFSMRFLHPGRTLLEKFLRVEAYVSNPSAATNPQVESKRIGRQYYDLWALLGEPSVIELLRDRAQVHEILLDAAKISQAFTSASVSRPAGGFASSVAFQPGTPVTVELAKAHDEAMRVLFYGKSAPTFTDVCDRVKEHAHLL